MAEDDIPRPSGSASDVNVIRSPQSVTNFKGVAQGFSDNYQSTLSSQELQKQHREILAQLGGVNQVNDLTSTVLAAAPVGYSQPDIQAMIDEIAALKQIVGQLVTIVNFQKQTIVEKLTRPT